MSPLQRPRYPMPADVEQALTEHGLLDTYRGDQPARRRDP